MGLSFKEFFGRIIFYACILISAYELYTDETEIQSFYKGFESFKQLFGLQLDNIQSDHIRLFICGVLSISAYCAIIRNNLGHIIVILGLTLKELYFNNPFLVTYQNQPSKELTMKFFLQTGGCLIMWAQDNAVTSVKKSR